MADAQAGAAPPLDEVMLAMDVVDTLRHNERLVERELSTEQRDQALIQRLREIYTAQGIEVTDRALKAGVKALKEQRFKYTPPPASFQTWLATVYVKRDRWGKPLLFGLALILVVGLGYRVGTSYWESQQASVVAEASGLLAGVDEAIRRVARDETALEAAQTIRARGEAALATGDAKEIESALAALQTLKASLEQEYVVRIVSRPGEMSGVFRIPADNPSAKNYYLIVEAIGSDGKALPLPTTSEEDGSTKTVEQWGLRVNERDYAAVAADKQDDGIIQNRDIGIKERGLLEPRYTIVIPGGAITAW